MTEQERPPVWRMVREAISDLGGEAANTAVRDWILERYPGTNRNTVQCHLVVCTVNHPSGVHYTQNQKPRQADGRLDFLFRSSRGQLELYDPAKHGKWEIAEDLQTALDQFTSIAGSLKD